MKWSAIAESLRNTATELYIYIGKYLYKITYNWENKISNYIFGNEGEGNKTIVLSINNV
jgi:hypothetical protein